MSKYASRVSDVPTTQHYVIVTGSSFYVPGDERSRTNPGHGYPASTEYYLNYESFTDRAEWEDKIRQLTERRETFRAMVATPAEIKTTVDVAVNV